MSPHLSGLQATMHVLISFSESEKCSQILEVLESLRLCCIICRRRLCLATCGSSDKGLAAELDQWQLLAWLGKSKNYYAVEICSILSVSLGEQISYARGCDVQIICK